MFRKDYNFKVASVFLCILFICNTTLYPCPLSEDTLRAPSSAHVKSLSDAWYRKLKSHDLIMKSDNPKREITRFDPENIAIGEGTLQRYIKGLIESSEKFILVTSPQAAKQIRNWANQHRDDEALGSAVGKILENAIYVGPVHYKYVERYYRTAKQKYAKAKPQRIIGIGMGSVTVWAKIIGHKLDVDVDLIPSALSTNGVYVANVAIRDGEGIDFKVCGYKVGTARKVIIDLDFVGKNGRGNKSGAWDIFNSYVALEDWKLAVKHDKEKPDEAIYEAFLKLLEELDRHADEIAKNSEKGIKVLAEIAAEGSRLLTFFGSGRPKAGSEHILSDELERQVEIRTKGKKILHGEQVGVTTLLMAYLYGLDYKSLIDKAQRMGLELSLKSIGLTRQDLINALVNVEAREGRFSYFDVHTVDMSKAKEAVNAVFGEESLPEAEELPKPTKVTFLATSPLPAHPGVGRALGIGTLTRILRTKMENECTVQEMDMQFEDSVKSAVERISAAAPDILGISVRYNTLRQMEQILNEVQKTFKGRKLPFIVIGGVMPTFLAEALVGKYPFISIVRGEGELAMLELAKAIRSEESLYRVASLTFFDKKRNKIISNPQWNFSLKEISTGEHVTDLIPELLARKGVVWVSGSRGCPGDCSFCSVRAFREGKGWEPRPIKDLIAEIKAFYDLGAREFMFSDDAMLRGGPRRWRALAGGINGIGSDIKFQCSARADSVFSSEDDDHKRKERMEALAALHQAGLVEIYIGFESGSDIELNEYKKGTSVKINKRAIEVCRAVGIRVGGGFIMVGPFSDLDKIEANIRFIEEQEFLSEDNEDFIGDVFDILRVQKGAPILPVLSKEILLDERIEKTLFYNYRFIDPKVEKIVNEYKKLASGVDDFMYNLKFSVGAMTNAEEDTEDTIILNRFLLSFKKLDLALLKRLVFALRELDDFSEEEFKKAVTAYKDERRDLIIQLRRNLKNGKIKNPFVAETLMARIEEISFIELPINTAEGITQGALLCQAVSTCA